MGWRSMQQVTLVSEIFYQCGAIIIVRELYLNIDSDSVYRQIEKFI